MDENLKSIAKSIEKIIDDRLNKTAEDDEYKEKYEYLVECLNQAKDNLDEQMENCSVESSPVKMIQVEASRDAICEILDMLSIYD